MTRSGIIAALLTLGTAAACSQPAPPPAPAAPVAKSTEARVQNYNDCWSFYNTKDWDKFGQCYADNATSENVDSGEPAATGRAAIVERDRKEAEAFPDRKGDVVLVLTNGAHIAAIAAYTGTNSGPMPGPDGKPMPATNKKMGQYLGHSVEWDSATGSQVVHDAVYFDQGTMLAQLGIAKQPARPVPAVSSTSPTVVISTNDEKERNNVVVAQNMIAAVNKHDLKATDELASDDYKLMDVGQPKDLNKKEASEANKQFMAAFPDLALTPSATWAAGDYVIIEGTITATNKAPMPKLGIVKATNRPFTGHFLEIVKIDNNKIKEDWIFYNTATLAAQLGLK